MKAIRMFFAANRQTQFFVFTLLIYMLAIVWTTIQAYARLEYSRTGAPEPIIIQKDQTQDLYDKKT